MRLGAIDTLVPTAQRRLLVGVLLGCVAAVGLAPAPADAQPQVPRDGPAGEPPVTLPRIDGIALDGVVDEAEWAGALRLEGVMHLPDFGAEPSERTVFYIAYDSEYLYFGCRAYDSEPDQVRITTLVRDVSTFNTDGCGLRLDTYNDEENALLFNTTPAQRELRAAERGAVPSERACERRPILRRHDLLGKCTPKVGES